MCALPDSTCTHIFMSVDKVAADCKEEVAFSTLLAKKGLSESATLTQTEALENFQLEWSHLLGIPYKERENPKSPNFSPVKVFSAADVARQAIKVHGRSGENQIVKRQREEADQYRREVKARIEAKEELIKSCPSVSSDPVEQFCNKMGFVLGTLIYKTKAMDVFGLEGWQMKRLTPAEKRTNPRNPRWAPMLMFRVEDVAKLAIECQTPLALPFLK